MDRPLYPFTAVVGQERAKQALLSPGGGAPHRRGAAVREKGDGQVHSGAGPGRPGRSAPAGAAGSATEDMLLGGVELEAAVRTGRRTFQPGLLARADGAVLYADEVNLLPSALTAALLDTLETGGCRMERGTASPTPAPPASPWRAP